MNSVKQAKKIEGKLDYIKNVLMEKNSKYNGSSLSDVSIFGKDRLTQIESRIDDKISRISNLDVDENPVAYYDSVLDVTGYFVLYLIALDEKINGEINGKD